MIFWCVSVMSNRPDRPVRSNRNKNPNYKGADTNEAPEKDEALPKKPKGKANAPPEQPQKRSTRNQKGADTDEAPEKDEAPPKKPKGKAKEPPEQPQKTKGKANTALTGTYKAFPPYGQDRTEYRTDDKYWIAERTRLRDEPMYWVEKHRDLMSFELWCVATGYDPTKEDGGLVFQQLLNYLLVDSGTQTTPTDSYYSTNAKDPYGPEWLWPDEETRHRLLGKGSGLFKDPAGGNVSINTIPKYLAKIEQLKKDKILDKGVKVDGLSLPALREIIIGTHKEYIHGSKNQSLHHTSGGEQGHRSNGAGHVYTGGNKSTYEVSVTRTPCSKLNWLQILNVTQQTTAGFSHGNDAQFVTVGTMGACAETTGCMAVGNVLAAIIGLYYYPGCTSKENNWVVKQTINKQDYVIRMRMWNANYTWIQRENGPVGDLWVQEELNNLAETPNEEHTFVGAPQGFKIPKVFQENDSPREPMTLIKDPQSGKTRLSPFLGTKAHANEQQIHPVVDTVKPNCKRLFDLWGSLVHEPDEEADGAFFGFNVPKAHWLYPHYPKADILKGEVTKVPTPPDITTDGIYKGKPYQEWPGWDVVTGQRLKNIMDVTNEIQQLYQLFTVDTSTHWSDRRVHALEGRQVHTETPDATPTEAGPSNVELVDAPRADELPPQVEEGEHTPFTDPIESTSNDVMEEDVQEFATESALDFSLTDDNYVQSMDLSTTLENESGMNTGGTPMQGVPFNQAVREATGMSVEEFRMALPAGSRLAGADKNPHFKSSQYQPWPHSDVYEESSLIPIVKKTMGEDAIRQYTEKYGSSHNLYLRGETVPKEISGFESKTGKPKMHNGKEILNTCITHDSDMHREHLCRILVIYFYPGEIGRRSVISEDNKTAGMINGVYLGGSNTTGPELLYNTKAKGTRLWKPVFNVGHLRGDKKKLLGFTPNEVKHFDIDRVSGEFGADVKAIKELAKTYKDQLLALKSEMTVLEWVTTPWHYAFLPYQPCKALFRDGETYSHGCLRCSRPFYEYEFKYAWYKQSIDKTQHWPLTLWHIGGEGHTGNVEKASANDTPNFSKAPLPFHDPVFWSKQQAHMVPNATDAHVNHLNQNEHGGWHNWPTYAFPLRFKKGILAYEALQRYKGPETYHPVKAKLAETNKDQFTFRRYMNHVWVEGTEYHTLTQGKISMGKTKLGMTDYKLMRSAKYGNTCRDCASVLELAPGLYERNYRGVYAIGMLSGNAKAATSSNTTWWISLMGRHLSGTRPTFNPDTMFRKRMSNLSDAQKRQYDKEFTDSMNIYQAYLEEEQNVQALGKLTKLKEPADIYIQKVIPAFNPRGKEENTLIQEAIRDLGQMLTEKDHTKWNINTENKAFRDMVYELHRKYVHKDRFEFKGDREFDSDMMRFEIRNAVCTLDGKQYDNCLITKKYKPRPETPATGVKTKPKQGGDFDYWLDKEDVETKTYYATRHGSSGTKLECDTPKPTMWCGDGHVTDYNPTTKKWVTAPTVVAPETKGKRKQEIVINRSVKQWRKLRQSNLFITYSLHRAIESEDEGRLIMERMADAAHELFGNDVNLADLLVFGHKVVAVNRVHTTDTISKSRFEMILAPNKPDPHFYGGGKSTSYIYDTYETHVESVTVDGGIEIGPVRHHPHFHILVTIKHWSYVQIDYFKMNAYLELMFKGLDPLHRGWSDKFKLVCASGKAFYTDNENPYVDIKLYPQDNWSDVIAAYVRKSAVPGIFESLKARTGTA